MRMNLNGQTPSKVKGADANGMNFIAWTLSGERRVTENSAKAKSQTKTIRKRDFD